VTGGFIDGEIDAAEDANVSLRGGRYSVDPTPLIDETGSCLVRKISDVDEPCLDELDIVKELGPGPYLDESEIHKNLLVPEEEKPNLAANGLEDVLYEVFDALFVRITEFDQNGKYICSYHKFSIDTIFPFLTEKYKSPAATGNVLITLRSDSPIWPRLVFTRLMDQPNFACKIQGEIEDEEDEPPEIIDLRIGADAEGPIFGVRHPFALEDVTVTGGADSILELFGLLDPGTKTLPKVYESVPVELIRTEVTAYSTPDEIMSDPLITPAAGGVKATFAIWDSQVCGNDTDAAIRTIDENGNFAMKFFVTGETYVCDNGGLNLHLTKYNQLEIEELTGEVRVSDTKGRIGDPADTSDPRTPDPDAPTIIR
ncbi:MAG: hypothetical protein KBT68_02135, partial [bacterium]|nr:hypothetical protein [Candidatus Colisoma equi]